MYILNYTTLRQITALDLRKGETITVSQLSKCASHMHVLSFLGLREKEGHGLEEFYSDALEVNQEITLGDFLIRRIR